MIAILLCFSFEKLTSAQLHDVALLTLPIAGLLLVITQHTLKINDFHLPCV